jgi:macrolide transport system ATP-binding/permease protein
MPGRSGERLLEAFAGGWPGSPERYQYHLLSLGLFPPDSLQSPVANLSTGQRRRLAVARLFTRPADLLLLDEPTNHLSLELVEQLEQALDAYPGAVLVVSHDRRLRARWRGESLSLAGG